jgi:MFS family permease
LLQYGISEPSGVERAQVDIANQWIHRLISRPERSVVMARSIFPYRTTAVAIAVGPAATGPGAMASTDNRAGSANVADPRGQMTAALPTAVKDWQLPKDHDALNPAAAGHTGSVVVSRGNLPIASKVVKPNALAVPAAVRNAPRGAAPIGAGAASAPIPALIWLLLGANLLTRAAGFAYPFLAYHVAKEGHAAGAAGAVLAAFGVGWGVGQLMCGWLIDRLGGRSTLVVTMLLGAVVSALVAEAHTVAGLFVGAVVAGLIYDAPRTVLCAASTELIPDAQRRAKVDALRYGWALPIGNAIIGGVGGVLAESIGTPALYWINAVAYALVTVVAACSMRSEPRRSTRTGRTSYWQAFSDGRLVLLLASSVATLITYISLFDVLPMVMAAHGLGAGAYGIAQMTNALTAVALTPLIIPWLSRRVKEGPRLDILAAAGAWMTVSMAAAALAHTTAGFSVAAAACAPGQVAWFVVAGGIVYRIAPTGRSALYQGIWGMALAAAAVAAPILASWSLIHGGQPLLAAVTAVSGLVGTALCLPLARSTSRTLR